MADVDGLLDTAAQVFLRYGYKKTSMEDVARAVGLSRQGLYLQFANKEDLFRATLRRLLDMTCERARAALEADDRPLEDRVVDALAAINGHALGAGAGVRMDELLEASRQLMGPAVEKLEETLVDDVAKALKVAGVPAHWKDARLSAHDLASTLHLTAQGIKHRVQTPEAFRVHMRVAVRLVVQGHAAKAGNNR